jgi:hypothetical protein
MWASAWTSPFSVNFREFLYRRNDVHKIASENLGTVEARNTFRLFFGDAPQSHEMEVLF